MADQTDFLQNLGYLALGSRLRRLSDRIMSDGTEIYREAGVDFEPRGFPLFRLLAERGPMAVGEAAAELGLTHAAISQTARLLEKKRLLTSKRDPKDSRRRVLSLTDEGRRRCEALEPLWDDIEASAQDIVRFAGVDVLAAIDGIEQALAEESLVDRTMRRTRRRSLEKVDIVDFDPTHREDFRRLNVEWLERWFTVEPIDEEIFANCEDIVDEGGAILFAKIGEEVVGTCALFKVDDAFELAKMAVTEAHRGKHIGKKLLDAALARARALGAGSVFLVTNSKLSTATSLYRGAGFRVKSSGAHPKYERGDLTMELTL